MNRFGKPGGPILLQKQDFFSCNDDLVRRKRKIAERYAEEEPRSKCKNCAELLETGRPDFSLDSIPYFICPRCNHVNGGYEESVNFCRWLYADDASQYESLYSTEDFVKAMYRRTSIFAPKAEFMLSALMDITDPHTLAYLDVGCGSGGFVQVLRGSGISSVAGCDVSSVLVESAKGSGCEGIYKFEIGDEAEVIRKAEQDVIILAGVLEHLLNPRDVLRALKQNSSIKYAYISIPVMSATVWIDQLNDSLFHRALDGGHTHIYTQDSINYLVNEFGFRVMSSWWFGTDLLDLYRQIRVTCTRKGFSERAIALMDQDLGELTDNLQYELDKVGRSSEVQLMVDVR